YDFELIVESGLDACHLGKGEYKRHADRKGLCHYATVNVDAGNRLSPEKILQDQFAENNTNQLRFVSHSSPFNAWPLYRVDPTYKHLAISCFSINIMQRIEPAVKTRVYWCFMPPME